jgi:hypothetical protein
MALFEFIIILKSIVIGLAMSQLLMGFASSLRDPEVCRPYWLHTLLVATVFLVLVQVWWESWPLSAVPQWRFSTLLLLLLPCVALFLVCHVLFPRPNQSGCLEQHYFDKHRLVFILVAITAFTSVLFFPIAFGLSLIDAENIQSALIIIFALILAITRKAILHMILVPAGLFATVADILLSPHVVVR